MRVAGSAGERRPRGVPRISIQREREDRALPSSPDSAEDARVVPREQRTRDSTKAPGTDARQLLPHPKQTPNPETHSEVPVEMAPSGGDEERGRTRRDPPCPEETKQKQRLDVYAKEMT